MKKKNPKTQKRLYLLAMLFFLLVFLVCAAWLSLYFWSNYKAQQAYEDMKEQFAAQASETPPPAPAASPAATPVPEPSASPEATPEPTPTPLPLWEEAAASLREQGYDIPPEAIDIAGLQQEVNPDIYAWITVPGTAVDYPVLQSPDTEDVDYYLTHNLDGSKGYPGCIYSQYYNSKDWSDPLTLLYGHNMKNGTMFASLHKYEKKEFFDENPYIYIYSEGCIRIYQIFAAYRYGDEHLLNAVNVYDKKSFEMYLESIFDYEPGNFNEEVELDGEDRILTLSTCIGNRPNNRWLVQGVLVAEQYWR